MSRLFGALQESKQRHVIALTTSRQLSVLWWSAFVFSLAMLAMPRISFADSQAASRSTSAKIDFRIVIPAIIRVTTVTQPDTIVIEAHHIANGYIDLDAATAVRLTNNTRGGYQLSAQYDSSLLSHVEVRISNQSLTASAGSGSMRVSSGLAIEEFVPIGYRLHLARGARAGQYQWPVSLAFSLAVA